MVSVALEFGEEKAHFWPPWATIAQLKLERVQGLLRRRSQMVHNLIIIRIEKLF